MSVCTLAPSADGQPLNYPLLLTIMLLYSLIKFILCSLDKKSAMSYTSSSPGNTHILVTDHVGLWMKTRASQQLVNASLPDCTFYYLLRLLSNSLPLTSLEYRPLPLPPLQIPIAIGRGAKPLTISIVISFYVYSPEICLLFYYLLNYYLFYLLLSTYYLTPHLSFLIPQSSFLTPHLSFLIPQM